MRLQSQSIMVLSGVLLVAACQPRYVPVTPSNEQTPHARPANAAPSSVYEVQSTPITTSSGSLETGSLAAEPLQAEPVQRGAAPSPAPAPVVADASSPYPPNPKPGSCYARAEIPAVWRTVQDRVAVREAGVRVEVVPAVTENYSERVVVRDESVELEVVPATYKTVRERVLVKPETRKTVKVDAVYRDVTEQVLVEPARTEWKRGYGFLDKAISTAVDEESGDLLCLVEIPARYETVTKRVLVSPETTRDIVEPAVYDTVIRTVVDRPATTRERRIPAEYAEVEKVRVVQPATKREIPYPAEYETVSRREKVAEARSEWREVLCEVNMTPSLVRQLQRALQSRGYYKSEIDGIYGSRTDAAANNFARSRGLATGRGYVTIEAARALGL